MQISVLRSIVIILLCILAAVPIKALPFFFFKEGQKLPPLMEYMGRILPPAVIGMLIIYCLRDVSLVSAPFGAPQLICCGLVVVLHLWKHNSLISIGIPTILYMILIQVVF